MKVLRREGFDVPDPIAWNRHTVVMEFIDSFPLRMIESVPEPAKLYAELMDMIVQLAQRGLIHGDFNEFNILIKELHSSNDKVSAKPILIDFPQAVSTNHANAQMYFDRDVGCVKRYFERRFKYVSDEPGPFFKDAVKGIQAERRLDVEVEASGFSKKMARELEMYVEATEDDAEGQGDEDNGDVNDEQRSEDGDESESEEEGLRDDTFELPHDDPSLPEQLGDVSTHPSLAVKPSGMAGYGLTPLDLSNDQDVVAEKLNKKKAAAGWAI